MTLDTRDVVLSEHSCGIIIGRFAWGGNRLSGLDAMGTVVIEWTFPIGQSPSSAANGKLCKM